MPNQILRYDQISCRLQVEGLPDVSAGQSSNVVGIITGWSLQWLGRPQLEGRREHLLALIAVVLPYARYLISGVARPLGQEGEPVQIKPDDSGGHQLVLRSSQADTPDLITSLDDAELADLVRVLDSLRLDSRLQLAMPILKPEPLRARELNERMPIAPRLAAPLGGTTVLALSIALCAMWPTPKPTMAPQESTSSRVQDEGWRQAVAAPWI